MLRTILLVLSLTLSANAARADDLRPAYLEIREVAAAKPGTYHYAIIWKAPVQLGLAAPITPTFPPDCTAAAAPERSVDTAALLTRWSIICAKPLAGRDVRLTGIEGTSGDALLRYQALNGQTQAARLTPVSPSATIAEKPDRWQVARTYFVTGAKHILMGYDHLLFVLCLVLLLSGAWRDRRDGHRPSPSRIR